MDERASSSGFESSGTFQRTEAMIRAAGRYLRPSDDLRPRTLEAARSIESERRTEQRLGGFLLVVITLAACFSPVVQVLGVMHARSVSPSAVEIHERAMRYAAQPEIGTHWGLAEAFTQMRRHRAAQLGQAIRSVK